MAATDTSKNFQAFHWTTAAERATFGDNICDALEAAHDIARGNTLLVEMIESAENESDSLDPRPIFTVTEKGCVLRYLVTCNELLGNRIEALMSHLGDNAQEAEVDLTKVAASAALAPDLEARR